MQVNITNLNLIFETRSFFLELCYPIFKRIHTDVFKTQQCWHVAYYLLHSLWNYTDKTNAMCLVCIREIKHSNILLVCLLIGCG
jgi:hypothetical protein